MGLSLVQLVISILVSTLVLPKSIHGHPATNDDRSILESRASVQEDFPGKISSHNVEENLLILPAKSRPRRLSDQRRAELESLVTLSKISGKRSLPNRGNGHLDPEKIGRRRRSAVNQVPIESVFTKAKRIGDPAYPLIS